MWDDTNRAIGAKNIGLTFAVSAGTRLADVPLGGLVQNDELY